ncbi:hypothetical protein pb186bvf_004633 [Paramecium bursaria]
MSNYSRRKLKKLRNIKLLIKIKNNSNQKMQQDLEVLFKPIKVGDLEIKNRFMMAALTRMRAKLDGIPHELHAEYYSQRHQAGIILTECTQVAENGTAFPGAAGIYNDAQVILLIDPKQVEGWKKVTEAVHAKGGVIFMQIWHAGRAAIASFQNGVIPVSSSNVPIRFKPHGGGEYSVPTELSKEQINEYVEIFRQGALRAKAAGLDGLELHGANGYLIDQFLRTSANKRTDEYGGSIENRVRFPLEVIDALISVFGAGRVGIKVSPRNQLSQLFQLVDITTRQTKIQLLYTHISSKELSKRNIAFIELMNNNDPSTYENYGYPASRDQVPDLYEKLRPHFNGVLIGNVDLTGATAAKGINDGLFDMASFGRLFISNPDLPARIKNGWPHPLPENASRFYGGGAEGYCDYPFYEPKQE